MKLVFCCSVFVGVATLARCSSQSNYVDATACKKADIASFMKVEAPISKVVFSGRVCDGVPRGFGTLHAIREDGSATNELSANFELLQGSEGAALIGTGSPFTINAKSGSKLSIEFLRIQIPPFITDVEIPSIALLQKGNGDSIELRGFSLYGWEIDHLSVQGEYKAKISFPNGDVYIGQLMTSKPDGLGLLENSKHEKYYGYFSRGMKHGPGKVSNSKDQTIQQGKWSNDQFVESMDLDLVGIGYLELYVKTEYVDSHGRPDWTKQGYGGTIRECHTYVRKDFCTKVRAGEIKSGIGSTFSCRFEPFSRWQDMRGHNNKGHGCHL